MARYQRFVGLMVVAKAHGWWPRSGRAVITSNNARSWKMMAEPLASEMDVEQRGKTEQIFEIMNRRNVQKR